MTGSWASHRVGQQSVVWPGLDATAGPTAAIEIMGLPFKLLYTEVVDTLQGVVCVLGHCIVSLLAGSGGPSWSIGSGSSPTS